MKISWIILALIALICFSIMVTLITFSSRKGLPLSFILFGIFSVGSVVYFLQTLFTTSFKFQISGLSIGLILAMGVLSVIGNYAQFQASNSAPNPGLAIAVVGLQSALIAILATVFFKDKVSSLQIVGMIIGLIGISMISLGGSVKKQTIQDPTNRESTHSN